MKVNKLFAASLVLGFCAPLVHAGPPSMSPGMGMPVPSNSPVGGPTGGPAMGAPNVGGPNMAGPNGINQADLDAAKKKAKKAELIAERDMLVGQAQTMTDRLDGIDAILPGLQAQVPSLTTIRNNAKNTVKYWQQQLKNFPNVTSPGYKNAANKLAEAKQALETAESDLMRVTAQVKSLEKERATVSSQRYLIQQKINALNLQISQL